MTREPHVSLIPSYKNASTAAWHIACDYLLGIMARNPTGEFYIVLSRAAGGSILFTTPMLMTMEMWSLGFYMDPLRLALMLALSMPLLAGLAYYSGFEKRLSLRGVIVDALVAYAVGVITSCIVLTLLATITWGMAPMEIIGKITLQAIPAGMGAVLASSQMASDGDEQEVGQTDEMRSYWGELFLMVSGALYFAFNMAPTEEMVVIAHAMTAWHTILLVLLSIGIMHAFVYHLEFHGQKNRPESHTWWAAFSRFTVTGYVLALGVSLFCMWSFGRNDGNDIYMTLSQVIVLGFPASIGAAAARLII
ncbi:MAG: TIGR02587 family membrane protein [Luteolibacter sp.]